MGRAYCVCMTNRGAANAVEASSNSDDTQLDEVARRMGRNPVRARAVREVAAREEAEQSDSRAEYYELLRQLKQARDDAERDGAIIKRLRHEYAEQRETIQSLREDLDAARQQLQRIARERAADVAALMRVAGGAL